MCGICGVVQVGGEPRPVVDLATLDRMTDVMTHRGPNDRGTYVADGIGLGVRRLSIVDVQGGHQPFANENKSVWAVQNGELYNHDEIRADLSAKGHRFTSRSDTEILPHLYEHAGMSFAKHLRGKFAVAVWDARKRRTVIARDRLGVKPLYYAVVSDVLVFGSELKSVLASGVIGGELDYEAIDAYLTLGLVPAPRTPLAGVSKLLPGNLLIVDERGVRTEEYWSYPKPPAEAGRADHREIRERLLSEIDEAVRLRLMSDVPLGAMLSGGLDSSFVVALMARHMSEPVKTFSVGFTEAGPENELDDARFVANVFGTDHHELELSFARQTVDLADLSWHIDEPLGDLSALGFLSLSELAARHVTVALSGQGADELLGGYSRHRNAVLASWWDRLPGPLRSAGVGVATRGPRRLERGARMLAASDPATRLLTTKANLQPELRERLVRGPLESLPSTALDVFRALLDGVSAGPLPSALYLDARLSLVDDMLHYFDRASMAHSLEVRVPFLDHHVVEFCATIPDNQKVRRLRGKHVLKEAARGIVPDRIIDKRKIGFFNPAVDAWFRTQAEGAISDYLFSPNPRYSEFLDRTEVERLFAKQVRDGDRTHSELLLSILMLEVWLASYLPRALSAPLAAPTALAH